VASDLYLTRIDELTRSDHSYLTATDECWFLREYTAGAGYAHSATNDLISNFKKPVAKKGGPEWKYKTLAIQQIAGELDRVLDAAVRCERHVRADAPVEGARRSGARRSAAPGAAAHRRRQGRRARAARRDGEPRRPPTRRPIGVIPSRSRRT
jgi:hypothetical protein